MPDPTPDAQGVEVEPVALYVHHKSGDLDWDYLVMPGGYEAETAEVWGHRTEPLFTRAQLDTAVSRAVREALEGAADYVVDSGRRGTPDDFVDWVHGVAAELQIRAALAD